MRMVSVYMIWELHLTRSFSSGQVTASDYSCLEQLGIGTVIDLRSHSERQHWGFLDHHSFKNYAVASSQAEEGRGFMERLQLYATGPIGFCQVYMEIVTLRREFLRNVFNIISDPATKGNILIHCAVGKDRTGIVIALLLMLLDVPDTAIAADYALSEGNIGAERRTRLMPRNKIEQIWQSSELSMLLFLSQFRNKFGSIQSYLISTIGYSEDEVKKLQNQVLYFYNSKQ